MFPLRVRMSQFETHLNYDDCVYPAHFAWIQTQWCSRLQWYFHYLAFLSCVYICFINIVVYSPSNFFLLPVFHITSWYLPYGFLLSKDISNLRLTNILRRILYYLNNNKLNFNILITNHLERDFSSSLKRSKSIIKSTLYDYRRQMLFY